LEGSTGKVSYINGTYVLGSTKKIPGVGRLISADSTELAVYNEKLTEPELTVTKTDDAESKSFARVKFTLTKAGGGYSKTQETATNGSTVFNLGTNPAGSYTLTEDPATTPAGSVCAEPITLTLDGKGQITQADFRPWGEYQGAAKMAMSTWWHISVYTYVNCDRKTAAR
jgi:hypothetical protein